MKPIEVLVLEKHKEKRFKCLVSIVGKTIEVKSPKGGIRAISKKEANELKGSLGSLFSLMFRINKSDELKKWHGQIYYRFTIDELNEISSYESETKGS